MMKELKAIDHGNCDEVPTRRLTSDMLPNHKSNPLFDFDESGNLGSGVRIRK